MAIVAKCQCRRCKRLGFDLWVRKILWRSVWQPAPVFLPGKSHGQRSLVAYSPWGTKSGTWLKRLSMHARPCLCPDALMLPRCIIMAKLFNLHCRSFLICKIKIKMLPASRLINQTPTGDRHCAVLSRSVMSDSLRPQDSSPPGSSVHGIFQARILEWVTTPFSRQETGKWKQNVMLPE